MYHHSAVAAAAAAAFDNARTPSPFDAAPSRVRSPGATNRPAMYPSAGDPNAAYQMSSASSSSASAAYRSMQQHHQQQHRAPQQFGVPQRPPPLDTYPNGTDGSFDFLTPGSTMSTEYAENHDQMSRAVMRRELELQRQSQPNVMSRNALSPGSSSNGYGATHQMHQYQLSAQRQQHRQPPQQQRQRSAPHLQGPATQYTYGANAIGSAPGPMKQHQQQLQAYNYALMQQPGRQVQRPMQHQQQPVMSGYAASRSQQQQQQQRDTYPFHHSALGASDTFASPDAWSASAADDHAGWSGGYSSRAAALEQPRQFDMLAKGMAGLTTADMDPGTGVMPEYTGVPSSAPAPCACDTCAGQDAVDDPCRIIEQTVVSSFGEHPYGEHPSRTLFVRNINSNVDDIELRGVFEQFGAIRSMYTQCKHRGFVMISYFDIRHAKLAMRHLQGKMMRRRKLDIHYSIPKENPSEKDQNQGTLVVFNLDPSTTNHELERLFGYFGEIKEVRETPNKKHHKFIEFFDVRDADKAMKHLNKTEVKGKKIKIEPSRPGGARKNLMHQLAYELNTMQAADNLAASAAMPPSSASPPVSPFDAFSSTSAPRSAVTYSSSSSVSPPSHSPSFSMDPWAVSATARPRSGSAPTFHEPSASAAAGSFGNGMGSTSTQSSTSMPLPMSPAAHSLWSSGGMFPSLSGTSSGNAPSSSSGSMVGPSSSSTATSMAGPSAPSHCGGGGSSSSASASPPGSGASTPALPLPPVSGMVRERRAHSVGASSSSSIVHMHRDDSRLSSSEGRARRASVGALDAVAGKVLDGPPIGYTRPRARSDASDGTSRSRRRSDASENDRRQFILDLDAINAGTDARTTVMVRNIPNKYTQKMLLAAVDDAGLRGTYDFFYLPIDFKNKCNVGYAFINFNSPPHIIKLYKAFNNRRWEKFNSEKVCEIAYARIQGKQNLISHFQNSSLMCEDKKCRPIIFKSSGPNAGEQEPFPIGPNLRLRRSMSNASQTSRSSVITSGSRVSNASD